MEIQFLNMKINKSMKKNKLISTIKKNKIW